MPRVAVTRVVSGGQTGADRAALDAAIARGIEHGGACPAGRRAEDGPIPARYRLVETPSAAYAARTEKNVVDSDGTLLITRGRPTGGSALTLGLARRHRRPSLHVDLSAPEPPGGHVARIREWLAREAIRTLNVAGPRESTSPGIGRAVRALLDQVLDRAE